MQVIVAKSGGFCQGVRRAVDTALSVPAENTYILGELIHNPEVVACVGGRGIVQVEDSALVPDGATLIIRSHGVSEETFLDCERRNIRVVDCTCGFVKKSQSIVKTESEKGKFILIAGHKEHPEVKGLIGWCRGEYAIVSSAEEDFSFLAGKNVVFLAQTTFSEETFLKIGKNLSKAGVKTLEIFHTVCYNSKWRQKEATELAQLCDAVVVIGGLNSSNTNKLSEIIQGFSKKVIRLENADEFRTEEIKNFMRVGIIAGASTPDWQTQEVLFKMAEVTEVATTMKDVVDEMGKEERYKKGQIITAKIVSAKEEGIYVSASGKLEIMIAKEDLDCEEYSKEAYDAKQGEEIEAMVVSLNPVKLSEKMVKQVKEEEAMLAKIEAGEEFKVVCTGFNKGGLTAQLGSYPVFVPAKEIRSGYVKDLEKYTGKTLRLKLIEIKKERRKEIIASQRVILEAEKQAREAAKLEKEEAFFNSIQVGDVVNGKVERVTSFGAFVSVNGFDCLAHISDLSWTGVKAVTDVLEIGKHYDFKILKIDREGKKVSIGYKQLQPQPWDLAAEKYAVGEVVHGKVVRIVTFGAFVELEKGIDGLVHVSQITHAWLENPTTALTIGQEVDAKILALDPEAKKITLSIKALEPKPETVEIKSEGEAPVRGRKARKNNASKTEDEEYTEWNEGGYGGASIAEMLHIDTENK